MRITNVHARNGLPRRRLIIRARQVSTLFSLKRSATLLSTYLCGACLNEAHNSFALIFNVICSYTTSQAISFEISSCINQGCMYVFNKACLLLFCLNKNPTTTDSVSQNHPLRYSWFKIQLRIVVHFYL